VPGAQSAGLFSKRLSRLRQGFVGQAEARAAIKRFGAPPQRSLKSVN